ncbi:hypothetical protein DFR52_104520 [Hoeflea marina]|uniref:Uncharacterized protein n=1 Tax=Hoeflea marina TaxID=274592 RepID=A0A317PJ27_9HYPH|nr:hypothetical protein [Hoeflea marina]PWV99227.1 hypothetical protein DFR52_104520 [Hoeflea marina]
MLKRSLAVLLAAALVLTGWQVIPQGVRAGKLLLGGDDPEAVAAYRLATISAGDIETAARKAIASDDAELAVSLVDVAAAGGIAVSPELSADVDAAEAASHGRTAQDAWKGFLSGEAPSEAALAGVVAADLSGYGDLRDLYTQARLHQAGETVDRLTVGLAAVGVVLTVATVASLGAALPAKAGISTIKAAKRAGRLSPALQRHLGKTLGAAIDMDALKAAGASLRSLDLSAARMAVRGIVPAKSLSAIRALGADVATLGERVGYRGTLQTLSVAENTDDVRRVARISKTFGTRTRAVLVLAGGAALSLASIAASLTFWLISALIWLGLALAFAWRMGRRILRLFRRSPAPGV